MSLALLTGGCSRQVDTAKPVDDSKKESNLTTSNEIWSRIHKWLSANGPKILGNLNPAASNVEIDGAASSFGCTMPDDWRQLYCAHNGMNSNGNRGSLFFGMQFLSLEMAVREYANSNTAGVKPLDVRAGDPGIRKDDMHNPKWIPFAHDSGDTLLRVDLDPVPGGTVGQVIFTDHADDTVILLAPSLNQFLLAFVGDLESGRYFLNRDALADGNEFLSCDKDIDVVNWSFSPRWKHLRR
jgi:cell wall assembly regulator SMI1